MIKKIAGFKDRDSSSFILIGQIGKFKSIDYSAPISIDDIISYILEVVNAVDNYIPCKSLLVECRKEVHDKGIYKECKYPFSFLQLDGDFYQYFRVI